MHPVLFHVGDFPVRSFGVALMVGFLVAIWMAAKRAKLYGMTEQQVQDGALWVILGGVLGARVLFIAQEWKRYEGNWTEIFKLQMDGLTSFGGLLGGAIAILVYARIKKFKATQFFDVVGVPTLVASAIGRVGCLLNGCCYGHHVDHSPPGVPLLGPNGSPILDATGKTVYVLPAQLADSAMVLLGAFAIAWLERKKGLPSGVSIGLTLAAYGLSRFFYEFLRAGTSSTTIGNSGITEAHLAALGMAIVGGVIAIVSSRKGKATLAQV